MEEIVPRKEIPAKFNYANSPKNIKISSFCGYLTTFSIQLDNGVISESGKNMEGIGCGLFTELSRNFIEGLRKITKIFIRTASHRIEIFNPGSFKYKLGLGPIAHDVYSCFVNKTFTGKFIL
jgi:hypothetical protein